MNKIEISAKTVEGAVKQAAKEFNVSISEIEYEILEESSRGFLGLIGSKLARIRATVKIDPLRGTKEFIEKVTREMGIKTEVIVEEENDFVKMTLTGENLGVLIGRRGETLDALQYLANLIANKNKNDERRKVILDAEGYRQKRTETLTKLAIRLAEKVKRTGYRVVLEPMNPQERRIIHTALQNDHYIQTLSEGEEPYRKVVISLKKR